MQHMCVFHYKKTSSNYYMPTLVSNISCNFSNYTTPTKPTKLLDGFLLSGKGTQNLLNEAGGKSGLARYLQKGEIPPQPKWCTNNSFLLTVSMKNSFSSPEAFYEKMMHYIRFLKKHHLVEYMMCTFEFYKSMDKLHMHAALEFKNHVEKLKLFKQWTIEYMRYSEGYHRIKSISDKSTQFHIKKRDDGPWTYVMKQSVIMTKLNFKPIFISTNNDATTRLCKKLYTNVKKTHKYGGTLYEPHIVRELYHGDKHKFMDRLCNENISLSEYNKNYINSHKSLPTK